MTGTNVTGGTLDFVTNDVDTVKNEKFIRLKIGQSVGYIAQEIKQKAPMEKQRRLH